MHTIKKSCFLLLGITFLYVLSCERGDLNNPFDKNCPKQIFTPLNFKAEQQGNLIKLTWEQENLNISGFKISRNENQGTMSEIATVGKTETAWNDNNIIGGTLYGYQLIAYAGENNSNALTVSLTPVFIAVVSTTNPTNVTLNSARSGGNVTDDGGGAIIERGVCYSVTQNPTIANSKTSDGTGKGSFTSYIPNLFNSTTYYIRAYATNSIGTAYGNQVSFTTAATADVPQVTTQSVSSVTTNSAVSGGNISNDGGSPVTARGICWSTNSNPTVVDNRTIDGTGIGNYTSNLTGLNLGETYYARAYATNSIGTGYGNQVSFDTDVNLPVLSTTEISSPTGTTATSGGNISSDGGAPVTSRGVCWSTLVNPTTANNKTENGTGTGSFVSDITGLNPVTNYYVRAYATNRKGTAYGNQVSFRTSALLPTLTTAIITSVTSTTAISGGSISSDGGSAITARGVCWSTSANPTVSNNKTINGSGTGNFVSSLSGLTSGTLYFIRAYCTNGIGTAYGNELTFTTSASLPTLTTTAITSIKAYTAISGGNISSDGGASVTGRGVCWSTSQNPTVSGSHTTDGNGLGSFTSNITGLVTLTKYYIRAYATNSAGTAYGNEINFTTTSDALPSVPINTYAGISNSATNLVIGWSAASGAISYNIYWSTTPGVSKTNYLGKISEITLTYYIHTGVLSNSDYYYVVSAENEYGESNVSAEVTARSGLLFTETAMTHSGEKHYYQVSVSSGQNLFVQVSLTSTVQDFFVYVKYGSVPTTSDYDFKSDTGVDEELHITNTQSGIYYIMVYASYYSNYYSGTYVILARTKLTVLPIGTTMTRNINHVGYKSLMEITVPSGQNLIVNLSLFSSTQDYFLYIKFGSIPTTSVYDAKSETGEDEVVSIMNTQAGTYYIMIYASYFSSYYSGDYIIRASQ